MSRPRRRPRTPHSARRHSSSSSASSPPTTSWRRDRAGRAARNDPFPRTRLGRPRSRVASSGAFGLPLPFVLVAVMEMTAELEVREYGCAAIDPVFLVMHLAPARRPVAPRGDAVAIAGDDGSPQRGRDAPCAAPHIEGFARAVRDDAAHTRIAGEPACRLTADHPTPVELSRLGAGALLERR